MYGVNEKNQATLRLHLQHAADLYHLYAQLLTGSSREGNDVGEWAIALVVAGLYLEMIYGVCR
jgi:hypothetical protein